MTPLVSRALAALAAATLALTALPTVARAQKALVYCPVGIDVAGCDRAIAALAPDFPDGVDRGYDGSAGTVDVKTAELWSYAVLVVPSLADGGDLAPYALLRDAAVSERLHDALMGRIALWSGTPDQGSTNREAKDALIRSLARWAGGNYGTVKGPGLVVLQDLSADVARRYGWLRALTGVTVTADSAVLNYASVRAMTATGATIVGGDGSAIAYTNMASLGFFLPEGAANVTLDAVGQTGTTKGGQVVLVTSPGGNTGTAVIRTDKDDYAPGTTVTIAGTGFQPGETVNMVLHEDPEVHENRTLTSVADANGAFVNTSFAPEDHDLDVRFILTAVGAASGMRAEATFTDGQPTSVALTPGSVSVAPGASAAYTVNVTMGGNANACTVTLAVTTTLPTGATASFNDNPISLPNGSGSTSFQRTLTITTTNTPPANRTPAGSYPFTVQASRGTGCQGNGAESTTGTLVVAAPTANTTVSVAPAAVTYPAASVSLSASVASTSAVNVGTVTFTVKQGTTAIGSATTSGTVSGGNASVTYALPGGTGAGSYTVEAAYSGGTGFNASSGTGTLTIGKANQTIAFDPLVAKSYGDAPFAVSATSSSGLLVSFTVGASDKCTISGSIVTITGAGSCTVAASQGGDANFNAAPTVSRSFTIGAKSVTPAITADNKQYDGTTSATILTRTLSGVLAADAANVSLAGGTATFADANVGNGKTVTGTGLSLSGSAAGNYALGSTSATTTANITARTVTPGVTVASKQYDGNTSAVISGRSLSGALPADAANVTLTGGTATFADKSVGTAKPVSITGLSLGGAAAGNYVLSSATATASADITALGVGAAITASNKVYDGTTAATIASRSVTGAIAGDAVTLTGGTAAFASKAVGTGKTVTASGLALSGADAGNYTLSPTTATTTADITARSLTVSATGVNKVYDGDASAAVTLGDDRVSGDALSAAYASASFNNRNVGTAKPVTVSGIAISGADAGNYSLASSTAATTANITAKGVTGSFTADDKVYDGTTSATVLTRTLSGAIAGDAVSLSGGIATFSDRTVGTNKTVTLAGASLTGADAVNYSLGVGAITTTADITARSVGGQITAANKTYDGNTTATITGRSLAGAVAGDDVGLAGGTAAFDTKSVGTGKTVTATGLALTGGDAGNYTLSGAPVTTTADIQARALVVSATGVDKLYDGTTAATVTLSDDRVSGDALTAAYTSASFASKTVGNGKTVSVSGISISGTDAGNYTANTTASTTANITARPLTVTATAQNKVYDATTAASASLATDKLAADVVTAGFTSATFDTKIVGTGKTVTVSGISLSGADAINYALASTTATALADITSRGITGSITAGNKVYDGSTTATIVTRTLTGVLGSDAVNYVGGAASFSDKTAGAGKTVTATGLSLDGADAANYTVNSTATTTASITPLGITGSVTIANKVYDATTAATILTRTLSGQVSGDAVSYTGGTASFADANAGTGKTVTATGLGLTGADAGNYTVNTTATTTADISKAQPVFSGLVNPTIIQGEISTPLSGKLTAGTLVPPGNVGITIGGVGSALSTSVLVNSSTGDFSASFATASLPATSFPIAYSYAESANFLAASGSGSLTVTPNAAPVVQAVTGPTLPVQLGSGPVTINATFSDVDVPQSTPYAATINWGDNTGAVGATVLGNPSTSAFGTVRGTHIYTAAGVYTVTVTVTDKIPGSGSRTYEQYVVVYDPAAGFVTGGGWINSPAGAYTASPTLSGKATFGFVSKYLKGATTPTGNTQFQFHAAGFDFKSTVYEWLVVSGARGQYKGSGTINGSGDYGFILTAVDGQAPGGGGTDFFRIKVFDKATSAVIYDNMAGAADDSTPGPSSAGTVLGGGSIQIQSK